MHSRKGRSVLFQAPGETEPSWSTHEKQHGPFQYKIFNPMEDLFQKALGDAQAEQALCSILCTNFPLYHTELQAQNVLAFIYLKNMANYLMKTNVPAIEYITSHGPMLVDLIYTASDQNFEILLLLFESLSTNCHLWPSFYKEIADRLSQNFHRSVRIFAVVFRRYEVLKATPSLHKEISDNIDLLKDPLLSILLSKKHEIPEESVDDLLAIFHSLIFQDIHPYFEDNMDKFFVYFDSVFASHPVPVYRIFSLCITKYSDCVDVYRILSLCLSRTDADSVVAQIVRKKEFARLRSHYGDIAEYVLRKRNGAEALISDPLLFTRNALAGAVKDEVLAVVGTDEFKKILVERVPAHLRALLGLGGHGQCTDALEAQRIVEIALAFRLQLRVEAVLACCDASPGGQLLLFTCVRYLLATGTQAHIDASLAESHPACAHIVMHYLAENLVPCARNVALAMRHLGDEFGSRLLFLSVRYGVERERGPLSEASLGIEQALHRLRGAPIPKRTDIRGEDVLDGILRFVYSTREVASARPFFYLFDALGLLCTRENCVKLLELSNFVLTTGIEELFHLNFYLLALLVKFGFDTTGIRSVVQNRELWQESALVLPLSCLVVALSGDGGDALARSAVEFLLSQHKDAACLLVAHTRVPAVDVGDEEDVLFVRAHRRLPVDIRYFRENYASARNVRKVVKALCLVGGAEDVVQKNLPNYRDEENVPFSVCEEFGL